MAQTLPADIQTAIDELQEFMRSYNYDAADADRLRAALDAAILRHLCDDDEPVQEDDGA